MNQKPPYSEPVDRVMKLPPTDSPRYEEALLDQAVAESFPASDPISPAVAARMERADVQWEDSSTSASARTDLVRRSSPALIALGTVAVAWIAMRALRRRRARSLDDN